MNPGIPIEVRLVPVETVRPLRHRVLRPHQTIEDCVWAGDSTPEAAHFAALEGDRVIGVASISIDPGHGDPPNTWRLRGMATDPSRQGVGVGTRVLHTCVEYVRQRGGALLWCNARTSALEFYRKHGFEAVGEEFDIKGIGPHLVMIRKI